MFLINLFDKVNGGLQIQSEIYEGPSDTFPFIFFLFHNEHMMVKELLKPFIWIVYAQLIESVKLQVSREC